MNWSARQDIKYLSHCVHWVTRQGIEYCMDVAIGLGRYGFNIHSVNKLVSRIGYQIFIHCMHWLAGQGDEYCMDVAFGLGG